MPPSPRCGAPCTGLPRSALLLKGQGHSQTFASPGTYEYICGLHPNMKAAIEVK